MSREMLLGVLDRVYADLAFRRRFERWPEGALIEYIDADLTGAEWQKLVKYPAVWLSYYSVRICPFCGDLAVVSTSGQLIQCARCQPVEEYNPDRYRQAS